MTPNLIAFGAVHVVSIAIMLAFVTLETKIQSDRRQRSVAPKVPRNRPRRSLRFHRLRRRKEDWVEATLAAFDGQARNGHNMIENNTMQTH